MKQNKRGISPVIATVLIIMITIAAIAILAGFLVPFVRNSLQKSTECIPYKSYYVFDESFGYNCYSGNLYAFSVKASFDNSLADNVEGMNIVLNDKSGASKVIKIKTNSAISLDEGGMWIINSTENIRLPGPGGIITYAYNASVEDKFISAEVYPVLKGGRICADQKETINIKPCEETIS